MFCSDFSFTTSHLRFINHENWKKMKKLLTFISVSLLLISCATLSSRTVIGPKKAFELGEGRHGSYTANITNDCNVPVEIFVVSLDGTETYLATLLPAENKKIDVSANTKAIFKNNSSKQAALKLKLYGNTANLSMGGPNY